MKIIDATSVLYSSCQRNTAYVIRMGGTNFYKIGHTSRSNFFERIGELQVGNPFYLEPIYEIRSERAKQIEEGLHWEFQDKRKRGEWFEFNEMDLEDLEKFIADWVESFCRVPVPSRWRRNDG